MQTKTQERILLVQKVGVVVLACVGVVALSLADAETPERALDAIMSTLVTLCGLLAKSALTQGRAERSGKHERGAGPRGVPASLEESTP